MVAEPGTLADLPPVLRAKTVKLAARALGELPTDQVPPALRRAAAFAPARRAKLAGEQIGALVDADPQFRDALAIQVRALVPDVLLAGEVRTAGPNTDPLDAAAAAYLVRPDGWEGVVSAGAAAAGELGGAKGDADAGISVAEQRLGAALASAREETKAVRERLRAQLEKVKAENVQLRRTVGATRSELRQAEKLAAVAATAADSARRDAAGTTRSIEAETRRLRSRVGDLEAQLAQLVRTERNSRDAETTRLRLLLDTVTEAAAGLRRELALPAVELLPADTVTAVEAAPPDAVQRVGRGLSADDPALLKGLLDLPRVHLLIDGYNVTKEAWPTAPLDQQRTRLIGAVATLVAGKRAETTVVFDAANVLEVRGVRAPLGIRVRFSPPGVIADDLIRQLVESEPHGRPVIVVTSDRELADSVVRRGARALSAAALIGALRL